MRSRSRYADYRGKCQNVQNMPKISSLGNFRREKIWSSRSKKRPTRAPTKSMKTFEEWMDPERRKAIKEEFPGRSFMAIALAWAAWQACTAEYQPEIDWRMEQYTQTLNYLAREKVALQAIIDEARKQVEQLKGGWQHPVHCGCDWCRLLAALDRSGARGGSVAGSPAPSLDNPPTNEGRSRT
jgi:hypothetical protein